MTVTTTTIPATYADVLPGATIHGATVTRVQQQGLDLVRLQYGAEGWTPWMPATTPITPSPLGVH